MTQKWPGDYIRTLEKRRDWLARRISEHPDRGPGAFSYDRQELVALRWAINLLHPNRG